MRAQCLEIWYEIFEFHGKYRLQIECVRVSIFFFKETTDDIQNDVKE